MLPTPQSPKRPHDRTDEDLAMLAGGGPAPKMPRRGMAVSEVILGDIQHVGGITHYNKVSPSQINLTENGHPIFPNLIVYYGARDSGETTQLVLKYKGQFDAAGVWQWQTDENGFLIPDKLLKPLNANAKGLRDNLNERAALPLYSGIASRFFSGLPLRVPTSEEIVDPVHGHMLAIEFIHPLRLLKDVTELSTQQQEALAAAMAIRINAGDDDSSFTNFGLDAEGNIVLFDAGRAGLMRHQTASSVNDWLQASFKYNGLRPFFPSGELINFEPIRRHTASLARWFEVPFNLTWTSELPNSAELVSTMQSNAAIAKGVNQTLAGANSRGMPQTPAKARSRSVYAPHSAGPRVSSLQEQLLRGPSTPLRHAAAGGLPSPSGYGADVDEEYGDMPLPPTSQSRRLSFTEALESLSAPRTRMPRPSMGGSRPTPTALPFRPDFGAPSALPVPNFVDAEEEDDLAAALNQSGIDASVHADGAQDLFADENSDASSPPSSPVKPGLFSSPTHTRAGSPLRAIQPHHTQPSEMPRPFGF